MKIEGDPSFRDGSPKVQWRQWLIIYKDVLKVPWDDIAFQFRQNTGVRISVYQLGRWRKGEQDSKHRQGGSRKAKREGSSFHRGECVRRKTRLVSMAVARADRPVQRRTQPAQRKSMYTVQKRTPILEVVLEIGTMIVRMMKTVARTTMNSGWGRRNPSRRCNGGKLFRSRPLVENPSSHVSLADVHPMRSVELWN